jgi:hypothetical protein
MLPLDQGNRVQATGAFAVGDAGGTTRLTESKITLEHPSDQLVLVGEISAQDKFIQQYRSVAGCQW